MLEQCNLRTARKPSKMLAVLRVVLLEEELDELVELETEELQAVAG